MNGGQWTRLVLMLLSDTPFTTVRVYLPKACGVEFTGGHGRFAVTPYRYVDSLQDHRRVAGTLTGRSQPDVDTAKLIESVTNYGPPH